MKLLRPFLLLMYVCFGALPARAQIESVVAKLLTDTIAIGRPFEVEVEAYFPASGKVADQPVTAWVSPPFECIDAKIQDERTQGEVTRSVWRLSVRSFDILPVQAVRVRMGIARSADTLWLTAISDSARLNSRLPENKPGLSFRFSPQWENMSDPQPAGRFSFWPLAFLLFLAIATVVAWRPIKRAIYLRRHLWEWQRLRKQLRQLQQTTHDQVGVLTLVDRIWKHYIDPGGSLGIRSLSTTELKTVIHQTPGLTLDHQQSLLQAARLHDQVVYAGETLEPAVLSSAIKEIYRTLEYIYLRRRQLIKQGKPTNQLGEKSTLSAVR